METPSIRASGNKGTSSFRPIPIEQALLEKAKHFLESYQFDLRIRQHLHVDKMEQSIGKHKYFILGNEQKFEPGYLIVMKGSPIVFLQGRLQYGFTVRLRLHSSLYQNQAIFVGTLDTLQASLRLEDVLLYEGKSLTQDSYSKRYATLQTFFESAFVQDTRLSGLTLSLAELHPLSTLKQLVDSQQYHTLEFVPEQGGRRRLFIQVKPQEIKHQETKPQETKPQETKPQETKAQETKAPAPVVQPSKKEDIKEAFAFKIKGLPDTYELKDAVGTILGKAAVQTTDLSILLRQAIQQQGKKVKVEWSEEFERYKIMGLVE